MKPLQLLFLAALLSVSNVAGADKVEDYSATIDLSESRIEYPMKLVGRSHHSGTSGELFTDLQTMTTALHIAEEIVVWITDK